MSKMLFVNTIRDIKRTKARFISIMLIVMLGVGFLVGVNSTPASMYAVADKFYEDTNLMDFRLISTVGFSDEDVKAVESMEGVEDVMPSCFWDVFTKGDTGSVIRLHAIPEKYKDNKEINSLIIKEGRMPQKADEIIVDSILSGDYNIGDTIEFFSSAEGEEFSKILENTEYEIVGIADSSMYISFERGFTDIGSGKVSAYMMIPMENFKTERYTDLYVTFSALRDYKPYSSEYDTLSNSILEELESTGELRVQSFLSENVDAAQASIDEAKATLKTERTKAEEEISSAQSQIDKARTDLQSEIASARNTLALAKDKLEQGTVQLEVAKDEFATKTAQARKELETAEGEITQGEEAIAKAKTQMKEGFFAYVEIFGLTREEFDELYGDKDMLTPRDVESAGEFVQTHRPSLEAQLKETNERLSELELKLLELGISPETDKDYIDTLAQKEELENKIALLDEFTNGGKQKLILEIEAITTKEAELNIAKGQQAQGKSALAEEIRQAEEQFLLAEDEIESGWREYSEGLSELEAKEQEALQNLDDAQEELNIKNEEAQREFEKAEKKILDAQAELDSIPEVQWICNTRSNTPGYAAYNDDMSRVTAVGKVFPIFFLLVAVLVCVTTMTRLIEEQRADLGAFTTLGYSKRAIIAKYIIYCISATLAGAAVGIVLGIFTIPYVIYNAYGMLYSSLPKLILTINVPGALSATAVAVICTSAVAYFTCNSLLKKEPATLLRPRVPKAGKRIFLERAGFIWNRLGFFSKVTVRNIFRYKSRFFMTILGVAGCTALIFSAFGLYTSINDVVDKQFGRVFSYDAVLAFDDTEAGFEIKEQLGADSRIESSLLCRQSLVDVNSRKAGYHDDTYICVPENMEDFEKQIHLQQRKSGEKIELGKNEIALSEKLALNLKVSLGDNVAVIDKDTRVVFTVNAICENYLYGYVYMSSETYEENFGYAPEYNTLMFSHNENANGEEISTDYLAKDGVLGVSLVSDSVDTFADMIESLNYVVLVMLVCAGALAFVVLYNLTNINIAERKREISTLKVLGFKDTETSAYIYRENLLLSIFGTCAGLILGVGLLRFIISTVEIDMLMFGREIPLFVFVISGVLTLVFAAMVNVVMHLRIKKIDMVESMKSVE